MSFVLVQYGDGFVEVPLAGIVRGTQLTAAAYDELGLDKDHVARHRLRLFHTVDGACGDAILPLDTGERLPLPGSIVMAVLAPGGATGAWRKEGGNAMRAQCNRTHLSLCAWVLAGFNLLIVFRRVSTAPRAPRQPRIHAWSLGCAL